MYLLYDKSLIYWDNSISLIPCFDYLKLALPWSLKKKLCEFDDLIVQSQVVLVVKNPPANAGNAKGEIPSLGQKHFLE